MDSKSQRGIPRKCHCGRRATVFTSSTKKNPGRPFFRCETKKPEHLFKWVEEAVYEEVEDAIPKFRNTENKLHNFRSEMEELKGMSQHLIEDVVLVKVKLQKWKFITKCGLVGVVIMMIVAVYLLY